MLKSDIARITDEELKEVEIVVPDSNLSDRQNPVTTSSSDDQREVEQGEGNKVEACRKNLMQYELLARRACNRCEKIKELRMEIYNV